MASPAAAGASATRLAALVSAPVCSRIAQKIGLADHVLTAPGQRAGDEHTTVLADACEAVIGALRDIFAGDTPYIFVKNIYAVASLAGGALCALLLPRAGKVAAIAAGMAAVILLRLLAAHFDWNLPVAQTPARR